MSEEMDFDWQEYEDGDPVECFDCSNQAAGIFYGYCPRCWKNLLPHERATLKGEEPPVEKVVREVVHHRDEVTTYKNVVNVQHIEPRRRWLTALKWLWAAGVTAWVAYAAWRGGRL